MKFDTILENKQSGSIDWTIPKGVEVEDEIQCFVEKPVLRKGARLRLRGVTSHGTDVLCFLRIFRLGWYEGSGARKMDPTAMVTVPPGESWSKEQPPNFEFVKNGPDWPLIHEFTIPDDWCDGLYIYKIETEEGKALLAPFWLTSPDESEGLCVCFSPLNIQARNWWGGASSTQVINGKAARKRDLYHQIGCKSASLQRPMYNPRGGDFLRWAYPLVRFLERHDVPVTYITDLDIEELKSVPSNVTHFTTVGPMRYWTSAFNEAVNAFAQRDGCTYAHLGAEAGQHLVHLNLDELQISFHDLGAHERLENPLTGAKPSGSKPRPPWGTMQLQTIDEQGERELVGLIGSSWDQCIDERFILAHGKGKHKWFRKKVAHTTVRNDGGRVFNAGVSNWTWGLSAFGRQGNIVVDEKLQRLTLEMLGQDPLILDSTLDADMIIDDGKISQLSIDEIDLILSTDPENVDALIQSGIRLFDDGKYELAHTRFSRAHELRPKSINATYRLARNHYKLKQYKSMVPLYHELLRQRPDRYHYVQQYAVLQFALGDTEQGVRVMKQAIRLRPNEPAAYVSLSHHFRQKKEYKNAQKYIQQALSASPEHVGALAEAASLAEATGVFDQAIRYWQTVLRLQPKNARAKMGLGRVLYRNGEYDAAFEILNDIVALGDKRYVREAGNYAVNIAVNHIQNDEQTIELAAKLLNDHLDLLSAENNGHVPVTQLALAFSRTRRNEEALQTVNRHRELFRNTAEFHLLLAQLWMDCEDYSRHEEHVRLAFGESEPPSFRSTDQRKRLLVNCLENQSTETVNGPLVSVIMTVYNHNPMLESAIQSVLSQTYENIELIVVDDCSPDDVFESLKELEQQDERVKIFRMDMNGGTYLAKNRGMTEARGTYIAFHDSDDWMHPTKLQASIQILEQNPELVAVFSNYFRVDENGTIVFRGKGAVRPACISLTMRKEEVINSMGYFDSVRVSADSEYEYRLLKVFGEERVAYLPKPYLVASVRSESLSQGGRFAVGWSGLSGLRLEYRKAYTEWHNSEDFSENHYIEPNRVVSRRFPAPEEMIW
jgi:tetratricopeptide (TPR) repeat protein